MVTTRRGTYPRGTYRFRPRRLVKRTRVVRKSVRRVTRHARQGGRKRQGGALQLSVSKRPRVFRDNNQYRQLETLTAKHGQKNSFQVFMRKLVKTSYDYTKYLFRGYIYESGAGVGGGGSGDTGGRNYNIGLERPDANNTYYPVYIFNLTTLPQLVAGSGINQGMAYRLRNNPTNNTTGSISWFPVGSIDNAGGSTGSAGFWQTFASTAASGSLNQAYPKGLLEYLNIKYTMRGPRARPTRFNVQIIQPYAWFQALPDNNSGYDTEQNTVWQSVANRNAANMCQSLPSVTRQPWRVLYARTYDIQPTSSTETDVGGHDIHQRYFWKCNRVLNYMDMGVNTNVDTGDYADMNLGDARGGKKLSCTPALGTNMYLLIQAYAPNGATAYSADIHPSFDLSIEKKMSALGAGF